MEYIENVRSKSGRLFADGRVDVPTVIIIPRCGPEIDGGAILFGTTEAVGLANVPEFVADGFAITPLPVTLPLPVMQSNPHRGIRG